jgi:DNA ligase-1
MNIIVLLIVLITAGWHLSAYAKQYPSLTLAKNYQGTENLSLYWVSEKYDGVRAYWNGSVLKTRSGNIINAPQSWLKELPNQHLDGELWIGHYHFEEVSAVIRRKQPRDEEWKNIKFMVFDLPTHPGSFKERFNMLHEIITNTPASHLKIVEQHPIQNHPQLKRLLAQYAAQGAEGLMLKHIHSTYDSGRSNSLLKMKPYLDDEAKVVAYLPGKGKYHQKLGALLVKDAQGRKFKIGTGFSDQERSSPPPLGSIITYQYHGETNSGLPRFPSYLRVKHSE